MAKKIYVGVDNIAKKVKKVYVGVNGVAKKVKKMYVGDANNEARLFYDDDINALIFASDSEFTLSCDYPDWNGTIQYSINNGSSWLTWNGSSLSGTASQPILLRGIGNTVIGSPFNFTGKYVIGKITKLLDYTVEQPTMGSHCFEDLFYMCTSLVTPPELPATTLTNNCYSGMFCMCTSLVTPPELPATTLTNSCYSRMFYMCTSLVTPPKLPATTLNMYCYGYMFSKCTSLTTLPELPATGLDKADCYSGMFKGCTNIKLSTTETEIYRYSYRIPKEGTGTGVYSNYYDMFTGTGGTFTEPTTINTTYYTDHQPI